MMVVVTMAGCVSSVEPREIPIGALPDPTAPPEQIVFPQDEVAHDSRLEWWYHNGHLVSESNREFGFHFVVFKANDGLGEPNLVAQLGIVDVETGEHYEFSRAEAGMRIIGDGPLDVGIADWTYSVNQGSGNQRFGASTQDASLSLQITAESPVMLHKEIGWLPTEAGATYYYSWPRQYAIGELVLNGETLKVSGPAWFDHQWGDFFVLGKPAGWQWFAIQLSDNASLMITQSRGVDGEISETYGTYMSSSGEVMHLKDGVDGIRLETLGRWTSSVSGGTYPSGWELWVESLRLHLEMIPVANDQEVQGGLPTAATYWEGKVWVGGDQNGVSIGGNAYVELSGYVDPAPIEWLQRQ